MTRHAVIVISCDQCGSHDATGYLVEVAGLRRSVDLCADHAAPLDAMAELLATFGRSPELDDPDHNQRKRGPGRVASGDASWCIQCGHELGTASGIAGHQRRAHGWTNTTADAVYGDHASTCPLCGVQRKSSMSVARHGINDHGATTIGDLWRLALEAGDPHGLVAMRRKELADDPA